MTTFPHSGAASLAHGGRQTRIPRRHLAVIARRPWLPLLATLLMFVLFQKSASGQSEPAGDPITVDSIRVGIDTHYKVGMWTCVEVTVHANAQGCRGELEFATFDGDGVLCRTLPLDGGKIDLSPNESKTFLYAIRFGRMSNTAILTLRNDGAELFRGEFDNQSEPSPLQIPNALPTSTELIVSVGPDLGLDEAISRRRSKLRPLIVKLERAEQLPQSWLGYECIDELVFCTSDPQAFAPRAVAQGGIAQGAQGGSRWQDPLQKWLQLGGSLTVFASQHAEKLLAEGGPLSAVRPGQFAGLNAIPRTSEIESYCGFPAAVMRPGTNKAGTELTVPVWNDLTGIVELRESREAVIVRAPVGFGKVAFVGLDVDLEPWRSWAGRPALLNRILGYEEKKTEGEGSARKISSETLGLSDMTGQLRGALDQFEQVHVIPFWQVAGLLFLYCVLISPLDRYLVQKVIGRSGFSWLTFAVYTAGFCILAYYLAVRGKGDQIRVNHVDIVDVDVASGSARGTTWLNLFSPVTTNYKLALAPNDSLTTKPPEDMQLTWIGLPGKGLGSMELEGLVDRPLGFDSAYHQDPQAGTLEQVPMFVWSTKSFTGQWHGASLPPFKADLTADGDWVLDGSLTNQTPWKLTHCIVLCGRWAYLVDELDKGGVVQLRPGTQRDTMRLLRAYKRIQDAKSKTYREVNIPYSAAAYDIPEIIQKMMFFKVVGGREYTGLAHAYQDFVDLSDHLNLGRAIVVAQVSVDQPLTQVALTVDGQEQAQVQHWVFLRALLPVKQTTTPNPAPRASP